MFCVLCYGLGLGTITNGVSAFQYTLSLAEDDGRVGDVFSRLSEMVNVKPTQLRMIEVFRQKVFKRYHVDDRLAMIRANDVIFV